MPRFLGVWANSNHSQSFDNIHEALKWCREDSSLGRYLINAKTHTTIPSGGTATARFWTWHDGWVKLTILPQETLNLSGGGEHEEGFSYWYMSYTHDGENIVCEYDSRSRDCDGPHNDWNESYCELTELHAGEPYDAEDMPADPDVKKCGVPKWKRGKSGQRDAYAESMDY